MIQKPLQKHAASAQREHGISDFTACTPRDVRAAPVCTYKGEPPKSFRGQIFTEASK